MCPGEDVGDIGATGVVPEMALAAATQSGSPFSLSRMISFGDSAEGGSFSDRARQRLNFVCVCLYSVSTFIVTSDTATNCGAQINYF